MVSVDEGSELSGSDINEREGLFQENELKQRAMASWRGRYLDIGSIHSHVKPSNLLIFAS